MGNFTVMNYISLKLTKNKGGTLSKRLLEQISSEIFFFSLPPLALKYHKVALAKCPSFYKMESLVEKCSFVEMTFLLMMLASLVIR